MDGDGGGRDPPGRAGPFGQLPPSPAGSPGERLRMPGSEAAGMRLRGRKPIRLRLNLGTPSSSFACTCLTWANGSSLRSSTWEIGKQTQTYRLFPAGRGSCTPRKLADSRFRSANRSFSGGLRDRFPLSVLPGISRCIRGSYSLLPTSLPPANANRERIERGAWQRLLA